MKKALLQQKRLSKAVEKTKFDATLKVVQSK
jgi:hypothetical protein